jgi:hypothetical protein
VASSSGSGSGKAEHGPLLMPGQRQTRVRQQLVRGQIARLAAVEDGLGEVRGEMTGANDPREIGRAHPSPLGERGRVVDLWSNSVFSGVACFTEGPTVVDPEHRSRNPLIRRSPTGNKDTKIQRVSC